MLINLLLKVVGLPPCQTAVIGVLQVRGPIGELIPSHKLGDNLYVLHQLAIRNIYRDKRIPTCMHTHGLNVDEQCNLVCYASMNPMHLY